MLISHKIQRALFSCNHRFEIRLFTLLPTNKKMHFLLKILQQRHSVLLQ